MFSSLRWRIAIPFILLIAFSILTTGFYLSSYIRTSYQENLEEELLDEARLIGNLLSNTTLIPSNSAYLTAQASFLSSMLNKRVTIVAADGIVVGESHEDPASMDNHLNRPEIQAALSEGAGNSVRFSNTIQQDMLYTAVPITNENQINGFIRLAVPLTTIQSNISQIRQSLFIFVGFTILIAILVSFWIADRTTKPLRELAISTSRITQTETDLTNGKMGFDEVDQLTQSVKLMTLQLQSQIEALTTERSRMNAVLSEMSDGVIIVDALGKVQLMNPASERVFRVAQEDAQGRTLIEILRHHQLNELWRECFKSGDVKSISLELTNPRLYLQVTATPLGKALPGSTMLLFQNTTQLRQLERVRQDFISNISHELRTPLASLKALTETLQEGALNDPPAAQRFLERMDIEVDSLSLMVSELLELSRIESGKVPLNISQVEPCDLIAGAVDRLNLQAERSGLTIEIRCSPDLPMIYADGKRLEQVLVNLLHNAIKFTPTGGRIIATADSEDRRLIFSVKDTGIGIPAEDQLRIFERFYKTDRSRASTGTGLGLAIARHLVEAHGGYIWVESREGEGSSFYFSIPRG